MLDGRERSFAIFFYVDKRLDHEGAGLKRKRERKSRREKSPTQRYGRQPLMPRHGSPPLLNKKEKGGVFFLDEARRVPPE